MIGDEDVRGEHGCRLPELAMLLRARGRLRKAEAAGREARALIESALRCGGCGKGGNAK